MSQFGLWKAPYDGILMDTFVLNEESQFDFPGKNVRQTHSQKRMHAGKQLQNRKLTCYTPYVNKKQISHYSIKLNSCDSTSYAVCVTLIITKFLKVMKSASEL